MSEWKIIHADKEDCGELYDIVEVVAHIRKNDTGEIRKYTTSERLDKTAITPYIFNWEENNYSCDCNRALFFGYAIGKEYDDIEHECGDGGYSVNLENPINGEIYYREFTNE